MRNFKSFNYGLTSVKRISLIIPTEIIGKPTNEPKKWNQNLFLLDSSYKFDIFQFIPREFIINTKNGSSYFNKEMMMNFSQTILRECKNPETNQFNLDIADEENVLDKFSQLFQGKTVSFTDDDLLISYKIIRLLNIKNCPNFMKPYDLQTNEDSESINSKNIQETESEAVLDFSIFDEFLQYYYKQTFSIITKKREYKCNIYAVYSSNVIREFLKENPEANSYIYDIEDEYEEFENINKIFNFELVNITSDNATSLDKMIKELEITCLYEVIDNFLNKYDQTNAEIDIEQAKIDEIDEIISLLHNIDEINFDEFEKKIIKYTKNKQESEIQEFCSFLIQFIKTEDNKKKQELVLELLDDLDKEITKNESLKCLMPQLMKQLLFEIGITKSTCSFAYLLYKKGKISKNDLYNSINRIAKDIYPKAKRYIHPYKMDINDKMQSDIQKKNDPSKKQDDKDDMTPIIHTNICLWFLPEIIQMNLLNKFTVTRKVIVNNSGSNYGNSIRNQSYSKKGENKPNSNFGNSLNKTVENKPNTNFGNSFTKTVQNKPNTNFGNSLNKTVQNKPNMENLRHEKDINFKYLDTFLPDKLDDYKQIRDNGEPHDELTKALRIDDVDKLQQILTMSKISKPEQMKVPYNMFEEYIENGEISYINYSAAYGSIKCFKYLLLNHHQIDENTFKYSIYGGNIEIIKIVDKNQNSLKDFYNRKKDELISIIILSIAKHRNDVFDWIINNACFQKVTDKNAQMFKAFLKFSAKNSNAHSLIRIFGKGYDISNDFNNLANFASANGFYKIIQLICLLTKKETPILYYHKIKMSNDHFEFLFPSFFSENISIFKLYIKRYLTQELYQHIIEYAITREYRSIIKYFFENNSNSAYLQNDCLLKCLLIAVDKQNNNDIFYTLLNYFQNIYPNFYDYSNLIDKVLMRTIITNKIEMTKEIIQLILSKNPKKDFSIIFANSVANNLTDLCHYILDNKLYINYWNLTNNFNIISNVNEETFSIFINNIPSTIKNLFIENSLNIAIVNKNIHLIKYLLDQNAKSDHALIKAVKTDDMEVVELVLKYFDTKSINENTEEGTALTIAVEKSNLEIVNKLLKIEGIDASLVNSDNLTALNIAIIKQDKEICNTILDFYGENLKDQVSQINESIKIFLRLFSSRAFGIRYSSFTQNQSKFSYDTKNIDSNQDQKLDQEMIPILKRILEVENVDLNCVEGDYSILSFACKNNERDLVEYLLKKNKINVNLKDPHKGNTALIVSILNCNYDIAKILIEHESTDLNLRNYNDETALTISVEKENEDIVNNIIHSNKFEPTKSRLNYAFYISSPKISKLLISVKTLDVNYLYKKSNDLFSSRSKSSFSKHESNDNKFHSENICLNAISNLCTTKIINIASSNRENEDETVDLIIKHPTFDKEKSFSKLALFKSVENKSRIKVFKKLFTLFNEDVNIDIDEKGTPLLLLAVMSNNDELVELILNDPKFDCNKSLIINAYYKSLNYALISEKLEKYIHEHSQSVNFDYIFPNGLTIFSVIIYNGFSIFTYINDEKTSHKHKIESIVNSINFLCENGANPNKPNKNGDYPLEITMDRSSPLMNAISIALINSNKIDLNANLNANNNGKPKEYEYYIHIAASIKDSSILECMIKNRSVDINIPDSNGNTPLMISCIKRLEENIKLFFTRDDLDFLHRNNEGKDALMLMERNDDIIIEPTQNKEEYLNKLLSYLSNPLNIQKPIGLSLNFPKISSDSTSQNKPKYTFSFNSPKIPTDSTSQDKQKITSDSTSQDKQKNTSDSTSQDKQKNTSDSTSQDKQKNTSDSTSQDKPKYTFSFNLPKIPTDSTSQSKPKIPTDSTSKNKPLSIAFNGFSGFSFDTTSPNKSKFTFIPSKNQKRYF